MIVGTAGHIDHGKTTLVRALTGVDTDRLPEEKSRGISIESGYAFLDVPGPASGDRIGFVDVPGHERLLHTMIAGATGIDFALLLVAADDSVMPQTREHLAVLSLLGITRGVVAITKVDRADAVRVEQVRADVEALLAGTPLSRAPVLNVSAQNGDGIASLRKLLFDAARGTPGHPDDGRAFRLAIDRAFTLDGIGAIVTGTVHAGRVKVGDQLVLTPSTDRPCVRVRSLHAQNQSVAEARAGQRCAVAIAGVAKDRIKRGQWLVAPAVALSTDRLDATVTLWAAEACALRSGTPVHVHIGATDVMASVAVLLDDSWAASDRIAPGGTAVVQLALREPVGAWRGDRVILRDASASRTLGGGTVLDPLASTRYRRTAQRAAELAARAGGNAQTRWHQLLDVAPFGVSLSRWLLTEGLAARSGDPEAGQVDWMIGPRHRKAAGDATVTVLKDFHAREPQLLGPDSARLRRLASPRMAEALWKSVLATLQHEGRVALRGAFVHLPEHALRLTAADERLLREIAPMLAFAGFDGAWARDLARDARVSEGLLRTTIARLAQHGELHQVVKDLCYAPETVWRLAGLARDLAASGDGTVKAARFRDATGLGRKRAIQLLEYFDRVGLLRRVGDEHRLRQDSALLTLSTR